MDMAIENTVFKFDQRRVLLSSLWLFVVLNIIFRDIHELLLARAINDILMGKLNGVPVTDQLMLIGAFAVELPIIMVLFARTLPFTLNRWLNMILAPIVLAGSLFAPRHDMDDVFFLALEVIALLIIFCFSWGWEFKTGGKERRP